MHLVYLQTVCCAQTLPEINMWVNFRTLWFRDCILYYAGSLAHSLLDGLTYNGIPVSNVYLFKNLEGPANGECTQSAWEGRPGNGAVSHHRMTTVKIHEWQSSGHGVMVAAEFTPLYTGKKNMLMITPMIKYNRREISFFRNTLGQKIAGEGVPC